VAALPRAAAPPGEQRRQRREAAKARDRRLPSGADAEAAVAPTLAAAADTGQGGLHRRRGAEAGVVRP